VSDLPAKYDAVICDLDGVLTDTARLHFRAWKRLFDEVLAARGQAPFTEDDYLSEVDGKPRMGGIRSLLAARGIDLPEGGPSDPDDADTVAALAARKNRYFRELLDRDGVPAFPAAIACVRSWRAAGMATAVVSSSKNCATVVRAAGIEDLFDVRVDGAVAAAEGIEGKPAPDMFLAAARRLGVDPARAVVVEDAVAGIEAGRRGDFGLLVGIDRRHGGERLRAAGADLVVTGVEEVPGYQVPHAIDHGMLAELAGQRLALFLDYDGTLSAIVDDPSAADMTPGMREALEALARRWPVAVVSGRERSDVAERVGLEGLYYAGSHGFDIAGPDLAHEYEAGVEALPALDTAEAALRDELAEVPGVIVERKRFSLAVHYRMAAVAEVPRVEAAVRGRGGGGLRIDDGKKLFELKPDVDWNKGRAVGWLLDTLGLAGQATPIYVGDDRTDEDAFRWLRTRGLGVFVGGAGEASAARYRVGDPAEVEMLLRRLAALGEEGPET
jgi:trehalose-phosphatase